MLKQKRSLLINCLRYRARVYPFYFLTPADIFQRIYFENRYQLISPALKKTTANKKIDNYRPYLKSRFNLFILWYVGDIIINGLRILLKNHKRVQELTGKNILTQYLEIIFLSIKLNSMPENYYKFEWYLEERRKYSKSYFHRYELKSNIYRLLKKKMAGVKVKNIGSKDEFALNLKENNLPIPETYFLIDKHTNVDDVLTCLSKIQDTEIYLKPTNGRGGNGITRFNIKKENNRIMMSSNKDRSETEASVIINRYIKICCKKNLKFIIQPRIVAHDDIKNFSGKAAPTVRIMTAENEKGEAEAIIAVFRMPQNLSSDVDNFHAGGIASAVDLSSGRLGEASNLGVKKDCLGWLSKHPENGSQIEGTILPLWNELKEVACRAHTCFLPHKLIGWDICITNDGPVIIEANLQADTDILQRQHKMGLKNHRFGELILHHLRD